MEGEGRGDVVMGEPMEVDQIHIPPFIPPFVPQPVDPKNGTHLHNLDCSPALIMVFFTLLGTENTTDWRRNNKQREKLSLVCKSWDRMLRAQVVHLSVSPTNYHFLFNNIFSFPALHTLNAYGSIGDAGAEFFSKIPQPTTFRVLDFSVNSIGEEGIPSLANSISNNLNLTKIDIGDNPIGDAGGVLILKALQGKPLEHLDVEGCGLEYDSLECFGTMAPTSQLKVLNWSYNTINYFGAVALATGLQSNKTLTKLKMRECELAGMSAIAVGEFMKVHPAITKLDISENEFADVGTKYLAESLMVNPQLHLTKLQLSGNNITESIGSIGTFLRDNRTLTYLDLSMNMFGDCSQMTTFTEGIAKNTCLKTLLLNSTGITDIYAPNIGKALAENKSLTTFDISNNEIENNVKEIAFALQVNTSLTSLNISKNKFTETQVLEIILALKDNTTLASLNISRMLQGAGVAVRQACKKVQLITEPMKPRVRV